MAGNTRFHSKFHYAQHHTEVTLKNTTYPDATTDPIASEALPFQGNFYSDGVLKINSLDKTRFNYFGNNTTIDSNLTVTENAAISGDLEVVGNVILRANPDLPERMQRIQIGDDKGGLDQIVDLVTFESYVDSDFSPVMSKTYNLGEKERRWYNLYVTNINLDGVFKIGTCAKDGDSIDKGMYIDASYPGPKARLGINTCDPNREFDLNGDMEIHGDIKIDSNKSIYWDSLSANNTKQVSISGAPDRLTVMHPDIIEFSSPILDLQSSPTHIKIPSEIGAFPRSFEPGLTIGSCLMTFEDRNRLVGINKCSDLEANLDVVGTHQLSGDFSKTYVDSEFLVDSQAFVTVQSVEDLVLKSTLNDISLQAAKSIQTVSDEVSIAAQSNITTTAGAVTIFNSPTMLTSGKRMMITADTFTKIDTPTIDINSPEIDLSTQNTSVKLIESQHALDVHNCILKINTTDRHVGINNCDPVVELDVIGDVQMTAPNTINLSAGVTTINSTSYTNVTNGNAGFNVIDPKHRISIPCGDKIGTSTDDVPARDSYIQFCGDEDNTGGSRDMTISNNNSSDIVINPGRSVVLPGDSNLGIGRVPSDIYALEVLGDTFFDGNFITSGTVIDETLTPDRVIFKDDTTNKNTTTDEFYYDGVRAALGHIPDSTEDAMLYVAKGPVKLASAVGKEMLIKSTETIDVDLAGPKDTALIQSPEDHNMVLDVLHNDTTSSFSLRFREEIGSGVYDPLAPDTKFYVKPNQDLGRAFFGFNTTDQSVNNDSSDQQTAYDVIINQDANVVNNLRVGNNLHVENNTTVDGMLTVNSEGEATGIEIRSPDGARMDLIDTIAGIDYRYEIQSHKDIAGGEVPGTGSIHASVISNATDDHMVLDLRNTSEDHRFAVRYSSDNSGVADKLVLTAGHYIYDIDNPDYDSTQPTSSENPLLIKEERQGHVGVNCIPTQDYHLDVNGNMRITGNFVVDGAQTTIQAASVDVEDKNILLNITPGGTSTNSTTNNAGILIQGDNNTVTGYVKVHPVNVDQLVAKAPNGQEILFDINGNSGSSLIMDESVINHSNSTETLNSTTQTSNNSTITHTDSTISFVNSVVSHGTGSIVNVGASGELNVAASGTLHVEQGASRINQDLTIDSKTVQFDGLYVSGAMTLPTANSTVASWAGSVRFNPTNKMFEGNTGGEWVPLNGWLADSDGDTYIKTKDSGAADNDEIEFYVDGNLVLNLNGDRANYSNGYGLTLPAGTTSTRPAGEAGSIRFNTEYNYFEGHNGTSWRPVGGVIDKDQDTYWTAHEDIVDPVTVASGTFAFGVAQGTTGITVTTTTYLSDINAVAGGQIIVGTSVYDVTSYTRGSGNQLHLQITPGLLQSTTSSTAFTIQSGGPTNYPGDSDALRAFAKGGKTFQITQNNLSLYNTGARHMQIDESGGYTRFLSEGGTGIYLQGKYIHIGNHDGSSTGLMLNNQLVRADAVDLNRCDITTVGQSQNGKVLTQSSAGVVTIGQTNGNQSLNIQSHDGVDAGLKLNGVLMKSTATELNRLAMVPPGTAVTGKALVLDNTTSVSGINQLTASTLNGGTLRVSGNAFVTGEVHSSSASDIKLKDNLKVIQNPLEKLSKINGYEFDWNKHDHREGTHDIGVVAQEVQQVLPEIVEEKVNNTLGVKYEKMIPLLIECVKSQQKQIDQLKKQLEEK